MVDFSLSWFLDHPASWLYNLYIALIKPTFESFFNFFFSHGLVISGTSIQLYQVFLGIGLPLFCSYAILKFLSPVS